MNAVVDEPTRRTPVIADVDVLVVGGGPAGVGAAVAAAEAGASTFLVEKNGFLGGMWTAGMVLTLAGFNNWLRPYQRCVAGVGGRWLAEAADRDGAEDNEGWVLNSDPEVMKLVADELVAAAGCKLLFHTWVADALVHDGRVTGAIVENVDGRGAIRAKVTVDCSGNGDLIERSGASWDKGQTLQPMTMPFRLTYDNDEEPDYTSPAVLPIGPEPTVLQGSLLAERSSRRILPGVDQQAMRTRREQGRLPSFGGPWFGGLDRGIVWTNSTRVHGDASIASELTRAEVEGRRSVHELVGYLRDEVPGFERTRLIDTSSVIGIRETRRLVGRYVLTAEDIRRGAAFDDTIAVGCWPIDVHPAEGQTGVHEMFVPAPYGIPFRSLTPTDVDGLLVAGRCLSTTREALGSTRVGATCAAVGQAAGVAAAIAADHGRPVADVPVDRLQKQLQEQGAIVDPADL